MVKEPWPEQNTNSVSGFLGDRQYHWWIGLECRSHGRNQWVAALSTETIFQRQVQYNAYYPFLVCAVLRVIHCDSAIKCCDVATFCWLRYCWKLIFRNTVGRDLETWTPARKWTIAGASSARRFYTHTHVGDLLIIALCCSPSRPCLGKSVNSGGKSCRGLAEGLLWCGDIGQGSGAEPLSVPQPLQGRWWMERAPWPWCCSAATLGFLTSSSTAGRAAGCTNPSAHLCCKD